MSRVAWLLLAALVPAQAIAQQVGSSLPHAPTAAIEAAPPDAPPMAVRPNDDERLVLPPAPPTDAPAPPPAPGSTTVQVDAEARPPENATPRFLFRDVTDRSSPAVKSLPERAAAIEAMRQSLGQGGPR